MTTFSRRTRCRRRQDWREALPVRRRPTTTSRACPTIHGGSAPCRRRRGRLRPAPDAVATAELGRPDEGATADAAGDGAGAGGEVEVPDAAETTGDATRRWRPR